MFEVKYSHNATGQGSCVAFCALAIQIAYIQACFLVYWSADTLNLKLLTWHAKAFHIAKYEL